MRTILISAFIATIRLTAFSQDNQKTQIEHQSQNETYSYAYISVETKAFTKKLKVDVDFGDTPEQIEAGKEYSEILRNKKSVAAVLNYMADRQFELVETSPYISTTQGTGGTYGIFMIMRIKK
jgi:hypothetical protein